MTESRPVLWRPSATYAASSSMARYVRWLEATQSLSFGDYNKMWEWSVAEPDAFWESIVAFFELPLDQDSDLVLAERKMPGAVWFPDAKLNFAQAMLRQSLKTPDRTAVILRSETFGRRELSWAELAAQVASVAAHFRQMGVKQGDRVVAILPNTETALVAFLATASIGAIWSLCAPDMGHVAILDRFQQIAPKVIITQDGYVHAGQMIDRRAVLETIFDGLPSVEHRVMEPVVGDLPAGQVAWDDLIGLDAEPEFTPVPFDHPLWVVYSSGTTGNPKPIVHGHGGVLLEGAKHSLHQNMQADDRYCWLTSSGWIMWNSQFSPMGQGATIVLFDGAPHHPDMMALWQVAADEKVTFLGVGAAFVTVCIKAGIRPTDAVDLGTMHAMATTGSPLTDDGYEWIYDAVKPDVWLAPVAGGTDLAGAFVGGNPMLPVRAGEMQCRLLGNAVRAYDDDGNDLIGEVGELVCTEPLPSMPLCFWGDEDGSRLHDSYFDTYPGVWRHGDWIEITPQGGAVIYGRSDATINRKGLRMGSSEIYKMVEGLPEVLEALVVDLEFLGRESFMPLFVVLADGVALDETLKERINAAIREGVSPRFIPNEIVQIAEVPRTLSGKKLEVPVKKLLLGGDPEKVVNRDSMANPDSFDTFIAYAAQRG
ncbi:acetoacetate--CoA ligase [Falsiphaeobacter marinintestinus]|uniref:acetoacetate--CoA ligase n=1 Tax=Falsiphaeobacter marinintestinus TaxID=1492905 RepID=UPI0011B3B947|nr:acetoacetate--CoA ligase [Phaeobacter marinintestinus]